MRWFFAVGIRAKEALMKVMIAGGGTGGHLFPALAIANAIAENNPGAEICFVNAGTALDLKILGPSGFNLEIISSRPFRGRAWRQRASSLLALSKGIKQSLRLLKKFKPDLVLAVGGYSALPLGLAAVWQKIPLAVQEQNACLGMVNRILSAFARKVFLGFPAPEAKTEKNGAGKYILTGNPIRQDILAQAAGVNRSQHPFTVLVWGGSQGARGVNLALMDSLRFLDPDDLFFIHQSGAAQLQEVRQAYAANGFKAEVEAFYEEAGVCYGRCHLVICRAGASSLSEMMALGRTGLCLPYPHAAGDHQSKNAMVLVRAGAMESVAANAVSGPVVAEFIERLRGSEKLRLEREAMALSLGKADAALTIARQCRQLLEC
jgi:UDP-N-acetylglucosamine--N-acetylmuramyl-(pentapeptide) pyrophosphoryl-undecaprenol N-acetylglucosamine transferase